MTSNPPKNESRVSVLVVLYNSSAVLEQLLASIPAASRDTATDVVVIDNASSDRAESHRIAEQYGASFVQLEANLGYGGGVNAGFAALDDPGDLLLICNADLEFRPGAIDALAEYATTHPAVGSVGPAILNKDGSVYPSARRSPSLRVGVGHALLGDIAPNNRWSQRYRDEATLSAPRQADWLSGACLLVPTVRFKELGGFDDGYFMYFEDVDLGDRLRAAGSRNVFLPAAQVIHIGAHSTESVSGRMLAVHHRSAYRYLSRRYRGVWFAPVRLALRIGLAVRLRATIARTERRAPHSGGSTTSG
ncbi:glycosyltransferase family 2 protein [Agromyces ramosus]|uniref:N-acetylglucosaminyl-diphospho-decaprenol L-rhamnosyltransferase n=1 Tax=Agromyces ramosus TaxID=33879 RepID=A0ABU0RCB4_9MICO|nr:glycosyltransferase family 2 protein [Agromyces ramosus]MDQ0895402.1 N-acetylglucosaminyl-diphospho-decaprenol L-rhamnosyltransferase [Agromyces ramosus]